MFPATISFRSGRSTNKYEVKLQKPAEDYVQGEQFEVIIGGRELPVHVEIPIDKHFDTLGVALD